MPGPLEPAEQLSERERIATDLANSIAHQLFQTSLELHSALARIEHHQDPAAQIRNAVDLLDHTLRDLRLAVFSDRKDPRPGA
ncbi:histidine kinase [Pseudonocardia acaciae]|uniref:histidine kinase n=1 Tax=Pseudonocardia acaciae TaxID=551276 RepID=UPI000AAAF4EE|nr:histidine kinase [Pseudonocardia acaciae]